MSVGLDTWGMPPPLVRVSTFEPIVVPGTCGGDEHVYRIAKGEIPEELEALLLEPYTENERQQLFHNVDLVGADHVPSPERPKALWIFGPPAVGKSTMADEISVQLFGRPQNAVVIDGDEIRLVHTGFQRVVQHGLRNNVVHSDAWKTFKNTKRIEELKKELLARAISNRQNLKIPDAGVNLKRVRTMLKDLEAADYDLYAICLWAPAVETQVRGRSRSVKAGKVFSIQSFNQAAEGCLELAHHWESQMRLGVQHYKSIAYYDNTVKPSHPVHLAQFEILTKLPWEEASRHAVMCKAAQAAYNKANVAASLARADGMKPKLVAKLWLMIAKQALAEKQAEAKGDATPSLLAVKDNSSTTLMPIHVFDDLVWSEKIRGRWEGLALGVALTVAVQLLAKFWRRSGA